MDLKKAHELVVLLQLNNEKLASLVLARDALLSVDPCDRYTVFVEVSGGTFVEVTGGTGGGVGNNLEGELIRVIESRIQNLVYILKGQAQSFCAALSSQAGDEDQEPTENPPTV